MIPKQPWGYQQECSLLYLEYYLLVSFYTSVWVSKFFIECSLFNQSFSSKLPTCFQHLKPCFTNSNQQVNINWKRLKRAHAEYRSLFIQFNLRFYIFVNVCKLHMIYPPPHPFPNSSFLYRSEILYSKILHSDVILLFYKWHVVITHNVHIKRNYKTGKGRTRTSIVLFGVLSPKR